MNLTLRRLFTFLAKSVLITRTTDGMLKDKIDIYVPVFFVASRTCKRISQGSYQNQVMDPGVNDAQKVNNILYSLNKMVKALPQHTEIE